MNTLSTCKLTTFQWNTPFKHPHKTRLSGNAAKPLVRQGTISLHAHFFLTILVYCNNVFE